jgi:hypothetical protein
MELAGEEQASEWELVMAGSVRNEGDEQRVKGLRVLAQDLGIAVSNSLPVRRISVELRREIAGPRVICC